MKAKIVGKIYNEKQGKIARCKTEINRVKRSIEMAVESNTLKKMRTRKQVMNFFRKKHALNQEIAHHKLFINMVDAGKILVKEHATDEAFDWFCQNNFDEKDQVDIAVGEGVSGATMTRVIAPLNKLFMSYIELELVAFLEEEEDQLKIIREWSEKQK